MGTLTQAVPIDPLLDKIKPGVYKTDDAKIAKVEKYMSSLNPYYLSLEDPVTFGGVRVPDMFTGESATFTVIDKGTFNINASSTSGTVCYGSSSQVGTSLVPRSSSNYYVGCAGSGAATNVGDIFAGLNLIKLKNWDSDSARIPAYHHSVRLVSAGIGVIYEGNTTTAGGKMSCAYVPKDVLDKDKISAISMSLDKFETYPGMTQVPVSSFQPVFVRWRPVDLTSTAFVNLRTSAEPDSSLPGVSLGALVVALSGLNPGSRIQYFFVGNYEAIVSSSLNISTNLRPSVADIFQLSEAMNYISNMPVVEVGYFIGMPQYSGVSSLNGKRGQKGVTDYKIKANKKLVGNYQQKRMILRQQALAHHFAEADRLELLNKTVKYEAELRNRVQQQATPKGRRQIEVVDNNDFEFGSFTDIIGNILGSIFPAAGAPKQEGKPMLGSAIEGIPALLSKGVDFAQSLAPLLTMLL